MREGRILCLRLHLHTDIQHTGVLANPANVFLCPICSYHEATDPAHGKAQVYSSVLWEKVLRQGSSCGHRPKNIEG